MLRAGPYRRHIENRIRAGNTTLPEMAAWPTVSQHQRPVPIASVAKVMTAYVVLKHYPLPGDDGDPRFAVSQDDVVDTEMRRRDGQSVVDVSAGEQLTERDALMAILLPSANNI